MVAFFIILIISIYTIFNFDQILLTTDRTDTGNLYARFDLQSVGIQILKENPLFGAYPGGWAHQFSRYERSGQLSSIHSLYLYVAVEWGIILAILLVLFILYAVYINISTILSINTLKNKDLEIIKAVSYGCLATSFSYIIHGITEPIPLEYIFLLLGISMALNKTTCLSLLKSKVE